MSYKVMNIYFESMVGSEDEEEGRFRGTDPVAANIFRVYFVNASVQSGALQ